MKKNRFLKLGIMGMAFFSLLHLILIFAQAPNKNPKALLAGYVIMASLTLFGVIKGVKDSGTK